MKLNLPSLAEARDPPTAAAHVHVGTCTCIVLACLAQYVHSVHPNACNGTWVKERRCLRSGRGRGWAVRVGEFDGGSLGSFLVYRRDLISLYFLEGGEMNAARTPHSGTRAHVLPQERQERGDHVPAANICLDQGQPSHLGGIWAAEGRGGKEPGQAGGSRRRSRWMAGPMADSEWPGSTGSRAEGAPLAAYLAPSLTISWHVLGLSGPGLCPEVLVGDWGPSELRGLLCCSSRPRSPSCKSRWP